MTVCALIVSASVAWGAEREQQGPQTGVPAPNTWVDARLRFVPPEGIPDARWTTTDGYSGSTYRSRTGTVLWRTGISSKAAGLSPGYYSNATLEWAPASDEARVIDVFSAWGGGSYGHGRLLAGFKERPMPAPRHVYDAFDYVETRDSIYLMLGSYWKVGLTGATEEARAQLNVDAGSTWRYDFADGRWHRIDDSVRRLWPGVVPHGVTMQPWPEANKILFFGPSGRRYAEFDIKSERWEKVEIKQRRPTLKGAGPGSSTWDSKRQLWVMRRGPQVYRLDPRKRTFDSLPPAYEVTEGRRFKRNGYLGSGITYIPRHDVYLVHCPNGNDTHVYEIEKGRWITVRGGDVALPFGNLEYDPKTDLTVLVWQLKAFRFRYVPRGAGGGREYHGRTPAQHPLGLLLSQ